MKLKKTEVADLEFKDSVLCIKPKKQIINLADMQELLRDAFELSGGQKIYVVIDTSENSHSTIEARKYYTESEYSKHRYADAIVVKSIAYKMIVNFYMQVLSRPVPAKMFNSVEDAIAWIEILKVKNNILSPELNSK